MIYAGIFLNLCIAGALLRPPPVKNIPVIKEPENVVEDFESKSLSNIDDEENDKKKNRKERKQKGCDRGLFCNAAYLVYCVSQVIFLAGFICYQLYIVPYATVEVRKTPYYAFFIMYAIKRIFYRLVFQKLTQLF